MCRSCDNFEVDLALLFHGDGFCHSTERVGYSPLLADHLTQIVWRDMNFISRRLFAGNLCDANLARLIYEGLNEILNQCFHYINLLLKYSRS